jgi:hypothetical protein
MTNPETTTPEPALTRPPVAYLSPTAFTVSIVWAVLAVIFAVILLANAKDAAYGADAYTGIQNAIMLAVRGIAFLLFGSAALGIIIAARRDRN